MSTPDARSSAHNLAHHFLIAMPGLEDGTFARSVVYLCEHSARGAMGLVINKPSRITLDGLLRSANMRLGRADLRGNLIYHGGPVQTDRGFVLHDAIRIEGAQGMAGMDGTDNAPPQITAYDATMHIPGGLEMTMSRDVLQALNDGAGPPRLLVTLGYASWGEGQLEAELRQNAWLTVAADAEVIFNTPAASRYERALALLGLQAWMIAPQAGHG